MFILLTSNRRQKYCKATMALPDPIPTVTTNAVAYNFARIGQDKTSSVYQTADGNDKLTVSRSEKARKRFSVRLDRRKTAADPFNAALNQEYRHAVYIVWDVPNLGVSATEADWHGKLLTDLMIAGTPDYALRVLQGEI